MSENPCMELSERSERMSHFFANVFIKTSLDGTSEQGSLSQKSLAFLRTANQRFACFAKG